MTEARSQHSSSKPPPRTQEPPSGDMATAAEVPELMQAAQVSAFGTPSKITVTQIPTPPAPSPTQLLIKVHSVSLSPSDYRILTGACSLVKKPPDNKFPYTPGGDISGTVALTHATETDFHPGDRVFATWDMLGFGGLAEFALVSKSLVYRIPPDVSFDEAAAMANSPVNAMLAVEDAEVKAGDRVLILGGGGGVGTMAVQLARVAGAGFVAATSTQGELVRGLGADVVVDYTRERWDEKPEFRREKFDVVIDMAEGAAAWARCGGVLKSGRDGGRFVAGVVNEWEIEIRNVWEAVRWSAPPLWRRVASRVWGVCRSTRCCSRRRAGRAWSGSWR